MQEHRNLQSVQQKGAFRIMCLGESTTQNQYPPYLEEILNQRNIGIRFSVIDKGVGGTNTAIILAQLKDNLDKYKPDMIVTMMGINDEGNHIPYEADSKSKIILTIRSFKSYKLARFIWLYIRKKYTALGGDYVFEGKLAEAEKSFEKVVELNPNDYVAYANLGLVYRAQGKFAEAEEPFKKAIELNPKYDFAYKELGCLYRVSRKFAESEQALKKAIELNPNNDAAYAELGWIYKGRKKFSDAEDILKKAIELNPNNDAAYGELGWLYRAQGKFIEAEEMLKKAIEINPNNLRIYGRLEMTYRDMGNDESYKIYAEKLNNLNYDYYKPMSANNYLKLKEILNKRNIRLVAVQYPMRSVESLKNIFKDNLGDGIIFVDNENIFKDGVKKEGYKKYFRDMCVGDFGHCTEKGNRLLAENIANAILKEMYGK